MGPAQRELFGAFPRRVGTPSQFWVFAEGAFDLFVERTAGRRNNYATLGQLRLDGTATTNSVLFDFDSPAKDEGGVWTLSDLADAPDDAVRFERMRADPDIADAVLGEICDEVRQLARAAESDGVECLGVFSGFGVHVHQLYRRTEDPTVPMTTVGAKYIVEEELETPDWSIMGQPERLCRVPNAERCTKAFGDRGQVLDGEPTGVYQIPITHDELREVTPEWLLAASRSPRYPGHNPDATHPQMPIWEEYRDGVEDDDAVDLPQRPVNERTAPLDDEGVEELLRELLQMPCMYERITSPNPHHKVRLNSAVLLFNAGLTPQQVENLFARLGWVDFDRAKTRKFLDHAYRKGYADMSCQSVQGERLCTRGDDPESCPCYGWSGGRAEWKT